MKKLCFLLMGAILGFYQAMALTETSPASRRIVVRNEVEFLKAIGSDRTVVVPEGVRLNLSALWEHEGCVDELGIMDGSFLFEEGVEAPPMDARTHRHVFYHYSGDGMEFVFHGLQNLVIEGEGEIAPSVVIEPRYAYVFQFRNCQSVTLRNLEIGHTDEGECMGGVLRLDDCDGVRLVSCDLYGCGTEGITAWGVTQLSAVRTTIRNCSYSIMSLMACEGVDFSHCHFFNNREYELVNVDGYCVNVSFRHSHFSGNEGLLFKLGIPVKLNHCVIHHSGEVGNRELLRESDCLWM